MVASNLKAFALVALALQASVTVAAHVDQQAGLIEAQSMELDFKNNNLMYRKVRLSRGNMSIAADLAQTTGANFENTHWVFHGNVKITMEQGQLNSEEAEIIFVNKLLSKASANGKPASFEQRFAKSGKLVKGRSDSIDYDVAKGVVHFSKNAWLSDGQNEIRGDSLKYNVLAQSIVAEGSDQGSPRVHIIITPPANPKP